MEPSLKGGLYVDRCDLHYKGFCIAFFVAEESQWGWDLIARNTLIGDRIDEFAERRLKDPTRYFEKILQYVEPAEGRSDELKYQIRELSEGERRDIENFYISHLNELEIRLLSQEQDAVDFIEEKIAEGRHIFLMLSQREVEYLNKLYPNLGIVPIEVAGTTAEDLANIHGLQRKSDADKWRVNIRFKWRFADHERLHYAEVQAIDALIKKAQAGRRVD